MRVEALRALEDLARRDDRIVFLTGDLGYGVVEPFFRAFPERAFNAGVAEQNMIAMATGLAEAGLIPYVYSIATFATLRPFEFIRNGPVVHHLPVRVIGVGGGMEYSNNGPTHFALEDVGTLRTLAGISVICPTSTGQTRAALLATVDEPGPIYFRLSKQDIPSLPGVPDEWDGAGLHVVERGDGTVALVALGAASATLPVAHELLTEEGVSATTACVSVVAPPPYDLITDLAATHDHIVTIEAHSIIGGLGSLVSEVVAEQGLGTRVTRCGVEQLPNGVIGSSAYLDRWAGIDAHSVTRRVLKLVFDS